MERYEKYKNSGIEWIGEIPEKWSLKRLKYLVSLNDETLSEKTDDETLIDYIEIGDLKNGVIGSTEYRFENAPSRARRIVRSGDVIVSTVRTYLKAITQISDDKDGYIASTGFAVLRPKDINSRFLGYYSHSPFFIDSTIANSVGVTYPAINASNILEFPIQIPTPEEQITIANHLDRKTAEIDELIADKKSLLELYEEEKTAIINQAVTKGINPDAPMKDSGIEWLREIPEHWEVKRIRHVAQIFGRIGYRGYKTTDLVTKGEGAITISPSNMKAYHMEFENCTYLSWEKYEESPEIMIHNDDILFVKTGSTYGKVSFVENLPEKATINPQIIVLKQISCNNKYLWYVLKSSNIIYQVERTVVGGTIPTISQAKINNYEFPKPSDEEQTEIVTFIDNEINRVDKTINRTKKLIDLLTEYRTVLISEVVTGKIKVTE